jgi:hypothetical protein
MGKRIWILGVWTSIVLGLTFGAGAAWAKPADLPVPSQPECVDGTDDPVQGSLSITFDLLTGRFSVEVTAKTEPPATIDAVCPAFLPALFEQLVTQASNALAQSYRAPTTEEKLANQLFRDAENCARQGQLEKARLYFQQTHLLAPTSKLGRQAIDRLQQIEERMRDAAEESTDPPSPPSGALDPEAMYRSIRNRTIPLGLVVVSY